MGEGRAGYSEHGPRHALHGLIMYRHAPASQVTCKSAAVHAAALLQYNWWRTHSVYSEGFRRSIQDGFLES